MAALETLIRLGRIARGNNTVDVERLGDRHVACPVKQTALAAGVRADLREGERELLFSGHSLRAGLASSAEVDEWYAKASRPRLRRNDPKYQRRRDCFRVNLTEASGL